MINPELKQKLAKIYELVNRGATEGERATAKMLLDKMLKKHNLDNLNLDSLKFQSYFFTYNSLEEKRLLFWLSQRLLEEPPKEIERKMHTRLLRIELTYTDYITLSCAYEYYRRHMKSQWKKTCAPHLANCRSEKEKKKIRQELMPIFFTQYLINSQLVSEEEANAKGTPPTATQKKIIHLVQNIEGGQYRTQVSTGHRIETPIPTLF